MNKLAAVLALAAVSGCVAVTYQGAGQQITPRAGQTLVFGRLRLSWRSTSTCSRCCSFSGAWHS